MSDIQEALTRITSINYLDQSKSWYLKTRNYDKVEDLEKEKQLIDLYLNCVIFDMEVSEVEQYIGRTEEQLQFFLRRYLDQHEEKDLKGLPDPATLSKPLREKLVSQFIEKYIECICFNATEEDMRELEELRNMVIAGNVTSYEDKCNYLAAKLSEAISNFNNEMHTRRKDQ